MTKTLAFEHGKNTIAVSYDIQNDGEAATLVLTPLFNYRVHHDASTVDTLKFDTTYEQPEIRLVPQQNKDVTIRLLPMTEPLFHVKKNIPPECSYKKNWM